MNEEFGQRLGKFVGLDQPPTLTVRTLQTEEFIATRWRWNGSAAGNPTRFERNDGYLVCLQRRDLSADPYSVDGRPVRMQPLHGGKFLLLDLNEEHAALVHGTADCISMYTSRKALDRFQEEHDLPRTGSLRAFPGVALDDDVIRNLGQCFLPAFERPDAASQLFADHVALALLAHLTAFYGGRQATPRPVRGGLAPWQERRAKEILLANMDGKIGLDELANASGLSRSHFARAFKVTTGTSPFRWLVAQRVERAKDLLLNSNLPIDLIADSCGFADQSHFTRTFLRVEKVTPGSWRRLRLL